MLTKCLINEAVIENLLLMLWSNRYFSIFPDAFSKIVPKFDKKRSIGGAAKGTGGHIPYLMKLEGICGQKSLAKLGEMLSLS